MVIIETTENIPGIMGENREPSFDLYTKHHHWNLMLDESQQHKYSVSSHPLVD